MIYRIQHGIQLTAITTRLVMRAFSLFPLLSNRTSSYSNLLACLQPKTNPPRVLGSEPRIEV